MLLGLDKFNKDFTTIRDGIIDKLSDRMIQRFLQINGETIQEKSGSHIEYKLHYHYISVHPMVQIYINHLMASMYRDVDINLTNIKVINPHELAIAFSDLFNYIRENSDMEVPTDSDLILVVMNSQLDVNGKYGFTTEFSYSEEQKMIDEIFKDNSPFAISEFVFPLTEPLTYNDEYDEESSNTGLMNEWGMKSRSNTNDQNHEATHCIVDWRELSLTWAYERDASLSDPNRENARNSAQFRINRNLELLRDHYDKKEQKRILLQMKQILNNDFLMNDELVNWIEGTYVVSDYIFIKNLLLFDVGATSFEWGSIHDNANIRLKSTFVDKNDYKEELKGFSSCQESMIDEINYVLMLIQRACKKKTQDSVCIEDMAMVTRMKSILNTRDITLLADIRGYYKDLLRLEKQYKNTETFLELSSEELELSIRITQIISDEIAHFVIPPFILTDSFAVSSHEHTGKEYTRVTLNHNHFDTLSSHSYYADFDESKVHSIYSTKALMEEVERSIHPIPEIKQKIHFQVNYFTHSEYEDFFIVDGSFFDYNLFRSEVEKLKLASQEFYFSFQEFKLDKEPRLQLALLQSMDTVILPHINNKRNVFPVQQKFLNTTTLFSLLKTDSNSVNNNDIQIYIFSTIDNNKKPLFLDEFKQVLSHSEGNNHFIFAIQNEQLSFSSPYSFNNFPLFYNLHNIMSPLLTTIFELLSSTKLDLYFGEKTHFSHSPLIEDCVFRCVGMVHACVLSVGSVDSFFTSNIIYSPFHIEVIRKSDSIIHLQIAIDEMNQLLVRIMCIFPYDIGPFQYSLESDNSNSTKRYRDVLSTICGIA